MASSCCVISRSSPRKVASTKRRYRSFSPSFILRLAIIILQYAMSSNGFGLLSIDWGLGPSAEQALAKARETHGRRYQRRAERAGALTQVTGRAQHPRGRSPGAKTEEIRSEERRVGKE